MPAPEELTGLVETITPHAIALRRRLHEHPEPAYQEIVTTELIRSALADHGIVFQTRAPRTGGWVDVGRPSIGFRADIDALPILEPGENAPRSRNDGWMHACGHDAHAAIAFGTAVILHWLRPDPGVRILFQPAEEANPGGAVGMVEEGLVDGLDALVAFHVDPSLPVGRIGARSGSITASADAITIVVHGPGGHTSRPHKTVDVVDAAARVVTELPDAIRRTIDARSAIVTAFGSIHGGDAANVIPTQVVIKGTVRTLDPELWTTLPGLIDKTLGSILALSGAGYTLDYRQGVAPVVNDEDVVRVVSAAIEDGLGRGTIVDTEQSMGGEDFSSYLAVTRGALLRLGAAADGGDLHSAGFLVDEAAIGVGIQAGVSGLLALLDWREGSGYED